MSTILYYDVMMIIIMGYFQFFHWSTSSLVDVSKHWLVAPTVIEIKNQYKTDSHNHSMNVVYHCGYNKKCISVEKCK